MSATERLSFRLLLITDWSLPDCAALIADALRAGPGIAIQHRHPGATDRLFHEEACRLRDLCGAAPLFISRRVDVALAVDAHLHLPDQGLALEDVRPLMRGRLISASWHPPAPPRHADLLLASPVFAPISKPIDRQPIGAEGFKSLEAPAPIFALGGIRADAIASLKPLAGVAVIGEVLHARSPARAAEALLRALD